MSFGNILADVFRGLGLIIRDVHRFFYRRIGARIWWAYIGIAFVICLWVTGQLWNVLLQILTAIILIGLIWLLVTAPFKGKAKKKSG